MKWPTADLVTSLAKAETTSMNLGTLRRTSTLLMLMKTMPPLTTIETTTVIPVATNRARIIPHKSNAVFGFLVVRTSTSEVLIRSSL